MLCAKPRESHTQSDSPKSSASSLLPLPEGIILLLHSVRAMCLVLALSTGMTLAWAAAGVAQDAPLLADSPEGLKALTLEDYDRWSTIGQVSLSSDGRWMTFSYAPNDGDSELYLRALDDLNPDPIELVVNGSGPVFSDDARWLAYLVSPGSGGGRGAGGEGSSRTRALHVRNLESGEETEIENPSSFSFSGDSRWLAVHKARSGGGGSAAPEAGRGGPGGGGAGSGGAGTGGEGPRGSDLILLEVSTGVMTNLGNVAEVAFNEASTHLAYVVDAEGRDGNGVHLLELGTARVLPLNTGDHLYEGLTWGESGSTLAILRGDTQEGLVQRENALLTFSGIGEGAGTPSASVYDPSEDSSFPDGFVLSEFRAPSWSEDGERVFVGIKEQRRR